MPPKRSSKRIRREPPSNEPGPNALAKRTLVLSRNIIASFTAGQLLISRKQVVRGKKLIKETTPKDSKGSVTPLKAVAPMTPKPKRQKKVIKAEEEFDPSIG